MSRKKDEQTIKELLRIEGVGAKGFGILPKYAMQDNDLGLWAKLLYAYLCSLAGSGNQTWPKRTTILADLGIGKGVYYQAQKQLLDEGYLKVTPTRNGQRRGANLYTLVSSPAKFRTGAAAPGKGQTDGQWMRDRVMVDGLKAGGYGMIPRLILQDSRLWAKAKLVYAYLASYAGAGQSAFPTAPIAAHHLRMGERAWQRSIRELTQLDYLHVVQRRMEGRFTTCDYILVDHPKASKKQRCATREGTKSGQSRQRKTRDGIPRAPDVKKRDIENSSPDVKKRDIESPAPDVRKRDVESPAPDVKKRDIENPAPDVRKRDIENPAPDVKKRDIESPAPNVKKRDIESPAPDVRKQDIETPLPDVSFRDIQKRDIQEPDIQNRDNISNNSIYLVTDFSSNQSIYPSSQLSCPEGAQEDEIGERLDALQERLMISDAEAMYGSQAPVVRGIWSMLREVLTAPGDTFQLGGQRMSKEKLWELDSDLLNYVLICLTRRQSEVPIRNMRNYLLTALCHAHETIDAFFDAEIRQHLR